MTILPKSTPAQDSDLDDMMKLQKLKIKIRNTPKSIPKPKIKLEESPRDQPSPQKPVKTSGKSLLSESLEFDFRFLNIFNTFFGLKKAVF